MRIVREAWRLLSISRHFVSRRKLRNYRRARHNLYTPARVSPSSRWSGCRVSTVSALTEAVCRGGAGCTGGALRSTGHVSPASLAAEHWAPSTVCAAAMVPSRHRHPAPRAFSPRHDNWYIDREFSVLRDIILVILVIVIIIRNTAIILPLSTRCNDRQLIMTHYLFCKKGGMKSISEYFHFICNMLQSSRSRRWHKIANEDRFLYLSIDRNWNKFVSIWQSDCPWEKMWNIMTVEIQCLRNL